MTQASMRAQRQVERRFPVRLRIAVPPDGLDRQLETMYAWLNETSGAEGWDTTPPGLTGVLNDAIAFYFDDTAFAHAFVAPFCCGDRIETIEGAFTIRSNGVPARRGAPPHKTPLTVVRFHDFPELGRLVARITCGEALARPRAA